MATESCVARPGGDRKGDRDQNQRRARLEESALHRPDATGWQGGAYRNLSRGGEGSVGIPGHKGALDGEGSPATPKTLYQHRTRYMGIARGRLNRGEKRNEILSIGDR